MGKKVLLLLLMIVFCLVPSALLAADGAALFVKLTCETCHGVQGKGMFRAKTKARYRLKKKERKKLKKAGVPKDIIKKLKPLYKKKFKKEDKFIAAVEEVLGKQVTRQYRKQLIKSAGKVSYRKGDPVKGFEMYPKLAGNKKIYLYTQMKDILEKRRVNGNTEAMRGIKPFLDSNKITDDDFKAIAEYLSKVK